MCDAFFFSFCYRFWRTKRKIWLMNSYKVWCVCFFFSRSHQFPATIVRYFSVIGLLCRKRKNCFANFFFSSFFRLLPEVNWWYVVSVIIIFCFLFCLIQYTYTHSHMSSSCSSSFLLVRIHCFDCNWRNFLWIMYTKYLLGCFSLRDRCMNRHIHSRSVFRI